MLLTKSKSCEVQVSVLREIDWVRRQSLFPSAPHAALRHYCMGYYIHSCPKMRYKAAFRPSQLLCPETFSWVPLERVTQALNERPYVVLARVGQEQGQDEVGDVHLVT